MPKRQVRTRALEDKSISEIRWIHGIITKETYLCQWIFSMADELSMMSHCQMRGKVSTKKGSQPSNNFDYYLQQSIKCVLTILYFNMEIMRTCTRAIISCMEGFCFKFHTEKRISLFCSVCNGACQVSVHFLVPFLFHLHSQFMHCAAVPFGCTTYCSHPW